MNSEQIIYTPNSDGPSEIDAKYRLPSDQTQAVVNYYSKQDHTQKVYFGQPIFSGQFLTVIRIVLMPKDPTEGVLEILYFWGGLPATSNLMDHPDTTYNEDRVHSIRCYLSALFLWSHSDIPLVFPFGTRLYDLVGSHSNPLAKREMHEAVKATCEALSPMGLDWLGFNFSGIDLSRSLDGEFYNEMLMEGDGFDVIWSQSLQYTDSGDDEIDVRSLQPEQQQELEIPSSRMAPIEPWEKYQ